MSELLIQFNTCTIGFSIQESLQDLRSPSNELMYYKPSYSITETLRLDISYSYCLDCLILSIVKCLSFSVLMIRERLEN